MTTRDALHDLVNALPEDLLPEAERRLAALRDDPLLRFFFAAPEDPEPLTAEELALVEEGEAEIARGETIPWEVVRDELAEATAPRRRACARGRGSSGGACRR